jgi:hypothetical protein
VQVGPDCAIKPGLRFWPSQIYLRSRPGQLVTAPGTSFKHSTLNRNIRVLTVPAGFVGSKRPVDQLANLSTK